MEPRRYPACAAAAAAAARKPAARGPVSRRAASGRSAAGTFGDAGFTLVEMLVVVAVIGVLAAVAVPRYMADARTSQTAEVGEVAGVVVQAIATWAEQQGFTTDHVVQTFDGAELDPDTAPAPGNDLLVLLPDFRAPTASKFKYVVHAAAASAGPQAGEVVYCVQATGRAGAGVVAGGSVLYSTTPSAASGWDGRLNRQAYDLSNAVPLTPGGYCSASGAALEQSAG